MKRVTLIAGSVLLIATLALLYYVSSSRSSETNPIIKIGYLNITASLPLFIAEEKSFFVEQGIEVETVQMSTSNQLIDAAVAGHVDLIVEASAVPAMALELQAPGRVKIFAASAITQEYPFDALLTNDSGSIEKLEDLQGKKIAVFPGSTASALLKKFLEDRGLDTSDIQLISLPPQDQLNALKNGSVDAVHAYEPTVAIALRLSGIRKVHGSVYADMLTPNPQGVALVSTHLTKVHPELASKGIQALELAMTFMEEHPDESREILQRRLNLDPQVAKNTVLLYMVPHDKLDVNTLQEYANMLVNVGELKSKVNANSLVYHE